jgi:hypothetical protein
MADIERLTRHAIKNPTELNALEIERRGAYRQAMAEK